MTEKPQLTIAVLYYGLLDMTLNCLRSLAAVFNLLTLPTLEVPAPQVEAGLPLPREAQELP